MSENMFRLRFFTDANARTKNDQPAHSATGLPSSNWIQFEVCGAMNQGLLTLIA
jgi:hypothetical protein